VVLFDRRSAFISTTTTIRRTRGQAVAKARGAELKRVLEGWKTGEMVEAETESFQAPQARVQKSVEILGPGEPDDDRYTSDELARQEQRAAVLAATVESLRQPAGPEKEKERQKQLGESSLELADTQLRVKRLKRGEAFLDVTTEELRQRTPELELEVEDLKAKADEAAADRKRPKLAAKLQKEAAARLDEWIFTKAEVEQREIDQAKVEVARLSAATAAVKDAWGQREGPGSYYNTFVRGPGGDFLPRSALTTEAEIAEARSHQLNEGVSSEEESESA
jgi:hypothetical protein